MQFVPANKLSSHREKAGCPLVAKSSSDGEFSSGEENRSRADNHFLCSIFLRVRKEERGNYFKGWSWTIETFFFLFSSFAATVVRRKQNLCNFIDWELKKINWNCAGPNKGRGVMSRVLHSSGSQTTKRVRVCMHENTYQNRRRQKQRYK